LADISIDRICNAHRPLIAGTVPWRAYRVVAWSCLPLAIAVASVVGRHAVLAVGFCCLSYSCYSLPSLGRLKRVPVLSKLIVSMNSLAFVLFGFAHVGGSLAQFPVFVAAHFLVLFTLSANVIDLKDVAGDRAAGIQTLPVLLGSPVARILISFSFVIAAFSLPFILGHRWFWVAVVGPVFSAIEVWLIAVRKPFNETPVMLTYLAAFITLITTHILQRIAVE
jgi:geranylgeranylglycerol-phosphate geranylgeranyltransferase